MAQLHSRRLFLGLAAAAIAPPALSSASNPWAPRDISARERVNLRTFMSGLQRDIPEVAGQTDILDDHVRLRLMEDSLFQTGTADLHPEGVRLLTLIAARMLRHPVRMEAVAHHHSDGQSYRSFIISQRRAQAVRAAMLSRSIPDANLLATGLGENFPIATNHTASGRATNRRVDLLFRTH